MTQVEATEYNGLIVLAAEAWKDGNWDRHIALLSRAQDIKDRADARDRR